MNKFMKNKKYKYMDVAQKIYFDFISNENSNNKKIPSERRLAKKYTVSRVTVRKSLDILEEKNFIYRKHGRGTFINKKKIVQPISESISFSKLAEKNDFIPKTELIEAKLKIGNENDINNLNLINVSNKTIVYLSRKRYLNTDLVSLEISRFINDFSFLLDLDLETNSIYKEIKNRGYKIKIKNRTIEIINANKYISEQLNIKVGTPVILILGSIVDQNNNIINIVEEYLLADTFKFKFSECSNM